jgi:L,D-transpeptidase catalytic domain
LRSRILTLLVAIVLCLAALPFLFRGGNADAQTDTPTLPTIDDPAEQVVEAPQGDRVTAGPGPINIPVAEAAGVSRGVLHVALNAVRCAVSSGDIAPPPTLTLIDYSRPSTEPRLWVFDMRTGALLFHELVAHGRGTGENRAEHFSDDMNSHQSSLGLFVTRDTYVGHNGYSLRLDGLEPGFNSRAMERAVVMHGAQYVNAEFAAKQGRLGRSWGCPALREAIAHQVIDTVRGGGVIFSYYPDQKWLTTSRFLNCGGQSKRTLATN